MTAPFTEERLEASVGRRDGALLHPDRCAIPPGTIAQTGRETTQVGFDGALYLQHPEPGQVVEVTGGCKAQLPPDLGSAQTVVSLACQ